jgi:serine/threonine protein kinase
MPTKGGAHGVVNLSKDGVEVIKVVKKNAMGELPYEFIMEVICRDRCRDLPCEMSRIAPITGVLETPREYGIRMPNLGVGDDLWDLIYDGRIVGMDVKEIARDVMQALYCLHARGIAHRDVKDSNVLVTLGDPASRAHLCDMSLACLSPHVIGDKFLPYTGRYRPPEVRLYGKSFDFPIDWLKADVYAMGALLARMAAAVKVGPAVGPDPPTRRQFLRDVPDFRGKGVILRMMSRDPERRPSVADAMAQMGLRRHDVAEIAPAPEIDPVEHIAAFARAQEFPDWTVPAASAIFRALPECEQTEDGGQVCAALIAKLCGMVQERDVLKGVPPAVLRRVVRTVVRSDGIRDSLHRNLRLCDPESEADCAMSDPDGKNI